MNSELENRIIELENKVKKLEKAENYRKTKRIISISIKIIMILIVVYFGYKYYAHINETYIKPYKETVDNLAEGYNKIKNSTIFSKLLG